MKFREWKKWCVLGFLLASGPVAADDVVLADDEYGLLQVYGALTESTCRLVMNSAWQEVDMGTTATSELKKPGDQGPAVRLEYRLEDCFPSLASNREAWRGNLLWSHEQPSVSISFITPVEVLNPSLIRVSGTRGIALRLTDRYHHYVRLGNEGQPLLLEPGGNTLFYYITPERTSAPLVAGAWHALIHFRINYD